MVYRLKTCPVCGKEHRQRGPNCSQSCANSARKHTEETKKKLSKSMLEYGQTPEGLANYRLVAELNEKRGVDNAKRAAGEYILEPDDYYLEVPFNMNGDDFDDDVKINW